MDSVTLSAGYASNAQGEPEPWRNEIRACKACGSEFQPKRRHQWHCNHQCRQRAYRKRIEKFTQAPGYFGA